MRTLVGLSLSWAIRTAYSSKFSWNIFSFFNLANMALWSRDIRSSKISSDLQSCSFTKYPENVNFASPQSSKPQFLIIHRHLQLCLCGQGGQDGQSEPWLASAVGPWWAIRQSGPRWAMLALVGKMGLGGEVQAAKALPCIYLHCREKTKTLSDNWENNHGKKYNWENSWQQSQGNWRVWTDLCSADRCKCG